MEKSGRDWGGWNWHGWQIIISSSITEKSRLLVFNNINISPCLLFKWLYCRSVFPEMYSLFYSRNKYAFMFSITPFCSSADNSSNEKHMWIIFLLTVTDNTDKSLHIPLRTPSCKSQLWNNCSKMQKNKNSYYHVLNSVIPKYSMETEWHSFCNRC